MPVMKALNIDGTTYTTTGEVTVTQTLSSGTEIGSVSVDGTSTTLYAPTIPVTSVNSKTGAVSLTASDVGALPSSTSIPTKTSDLTNDSGFITSNLITGVKGNAESSYRTGNINLTPANIGAQATLVSGTNIKTINNTSLLGSGNISVLSSLPTATTSTLGGVKVDGTSITISDGVISASVPTNIPSIATATASLTVAGWSNNSQTVNVTGVTANSVIIATYAPESKTDYVAADVYCSAQGSGTLTFSCTTVPASALTVNILIINDATTLANARGVSF